MRRRMGYVVARDRSGGTRPGEAVQRMKKLFIRCRVCSAFAWDRHPAGAEPPHQQDVLLCAAHRDGPAASGWVVPAGGSFLQRGASGARWAVLAMSVAQLAKPRSADSFDSGRAPKVPHCANAPSAAHSYRRTCFSASLCEGLDPTGVLACLGGQAILEEARPMAGARGRNARQSAGRTGLAIAAVFIFEWFGWCSGEFVDAALRPLPDSAASGSAAPTTRYP